MFNSKRVVMGLTLAVIVLASLAPFVNADTHLQQIMGKGEIVAVLDATIPPLAYIDPNTGNVVGFCTDLIHLYADKLGIQATIVNSEWAGVVPSLLTGKVDVIAANLTTTITRSVKMTFVDPWLLTGSVAVVKKGSPLQHLADLDSENVKIGISKGSLYETTVPADFPKAQILRFASKADWTEALVTGRIDAVIDAQVLLSDLFKIYPDQFAFLPEFYMVESYSFAVQMGDWALRDSLNIFFREIKFNGEYAKLYKKWMGVDWTPTLTGAGT